MHNYRGGTSCTFSTIYSDFIHSKFQILLIQYTYRILSCVWLYGLPWLPTWPLFAVIGFLVTYSFLRNETVCGPWIDIHYRNCTSHPHSCGTGASKPSSSRAQSVPLLLLGLVLFWFLVYLVVWEIIAWFLQIFALLPTLFAIFALLILWLLDT